MPNILSSARCRTRSPDSVSAPLTVGKLPVVRWVWRSVRRSHPANSRTPGGITATWIKASCSKQRSPCAREKSLRGREKSLCGREKSLCGREKSLRGKDESLYSAARRISLPAPRCLLATRSRLSPTGSIATDARSVPPTLDSRAPHLGIAPGDRTPPVVQLRARSPGPNSATAPASPNRSASARPAVSKPPAASVR